MELVRSHIVSLAVVMYLEGLRRPLEDGAIYESAATATYLLASELRTAHAIDAAHKDDVEKGFQVARAIHLSLQRSRAESLHFPGRWVRLLLSSRMLPLSHLAGRPKARLLQTSEKRLQPP